MRTALIAALLNRKKKIFCINFNIMVKANAVSIKLQFNYNAGHYRHGNFGVV